MRSDIIIRSLTATQIPNAMSGQIIPTRLSLLALLLIITTIAATAQIPTAVPTKGPTGGTVTAVIAAANGTLFAGSANGLYRADIDASSWRQHRYPGELVTGLRRDSAGTIYMLISGRIERSDDNGATWEPMETGGWESLDLAARANGELIQIARTWGSGRALFSRSIDGGESWDPIMLTDPENPGINGIASAAHVSVVGDSTIWIALDRFAYRSTDGGASWCQTHIVPIVGGEPGDDGGIIALAAIGRGDSAIVVDRRGTTLLTGCLVDGAETVFHQGLDLTAIILDGDGNLLASSYGQGVQRSTDRGATWVRYSYIVDDLNDLALLPNNALLLAGNRYGTFLGNGDRSAWNRTTNDLTLLDVTELVPATAGGMIAMGDRRFHITRSSGQAWSEPYTSIDHLSLIHRAEGGDLYVGSATTSLVSRSQNDGEFWRTIRTPAGSAITSLMVADSLLLVGVRGTRSGSFEQPPNLWRSTNGTETWSQVLRNVLIEEIVRIDTGHFIARAARNPEIGVMRTGLFESTDSGATWGRVASMPDTNLLGLLATSDGRLYTLTLSNRLYRSEDSARTWVETEGQLARPPVMPVAGPDGALYVATDDEVYLSRDGARTWELAMTGLPEASWAIGVDSSGLIYAGTRYLPVYRAEFVTTSVPIVEADAVESHRSRLRIERIGPNPATDRITLTIVSGNDNASTGTTERMEIADAVGRIVATITFERDGSTTAVPVDVSGLPSGIYFVRVEGGGGVPIAFSIVR